MQPQDDPADRPLWALLERAPTPRVPGNFADNVLRRIRLEEAKQPEYSFVGWLAKSWKVMSGLTVGVALLTSALVFQEKTMTSQPLAMNEAPELSALIASVPVSDLADLGEFDTSLDDNDVWLGTASY